MAARNQQQQVREVDSVGQAHSERVRFKVVDRDERLVPRKRQRLRRCQSNHDTADKSRPRCRSNRVDIGRRNSGFRKAASITESSAST